MYDLAPKSLKKEPNGSISYVSAGDVVSINVYNPKGAFVPDGHVLIVSAVSGSTVTYVSQNAGTNTAGTVTTTGTFSGGKLTVKHSGKWTYRVIGIVHAPNSTPAWKASAVPLPANAVKGSGKLEATSCPSATECVAVGYYADTSGNTDALLLTRSGGTWTAAEAPVPANAASNPGAEGPSLREVSCPSVSECVAIGDYTDTSGNFDGMVLTWSAGTWTAAEAPLPPNAISEPTGVGEVQLFALSCPSVSECVVGGWYATSTTSEGDAGSGDALLLTWSAGTWTAAEAPVPANAAITATNFAAEVSFISCPSVSECVATGDYTDTSGNNDGMVLTWSAGTWTAAEAPLPPNAAAGNGQDVTALSCPSVSECVAVGSYWTSGDVTTDGLVMTWSAGAWTAAEAPLPANAADGASVGSVSCPSVSECVAVGNYTDSSSGDLDAMLLTWSAGTWTAAEAPAPPNAARSSGLLQATSCTSASRCVAVGFYADTSGDTEGMVLTWSAGTWTAAETSLPPSAATGYTQDVSSLSCPAASACVATANYTSTSGNGGALLLTGAA